MIELFNAGFLTHGNLLCLRNTTGARPGPLRLTCVTRDPAELDRADPHIQRFRARARTLEFTEWRFVVASPRPHRGGIFTEPSHARLATPPSPPRAADQRAQRRRDGARWARGERAVPAPRARGAGAARGYARRRARRVRRSDRRARWRRPRGPRARVRAAVSPDEHRRGARAAAGAADARRASRRWPRRRGGSADRSRR